ncbi:pectate lyase B [Coprinopsis cinerea AmutBmut pab1-1]|nr:pectate lyase B [Coprinopsis cinerea AmutBmut pab1-1]
MKWFNGFVVLFGAQLALASPLGLTKRAAISDTANIGFATLNGGTTGGSGGTTTTVSTLAALTSAVSGDARKTVIISGTISGDTVVRVGSNTSVIGKRGSALVGVGLRVYRASNVIIRNVKISKVKASAGDAIGVQEASRVWLDHLDLSSDRNSDKDFYDGLLDITHGCTSITVSHSKLYNHWKGSLVGHSDNNASEDQKITVTYAYNYWSNINSRTPSFRFGTGHVFNNFFENVGDGINTRKGAQLLVENNVFTGTKKPLYSTDGGFAVATGNDFGGGSNTAPGGSFTRPQYGYNLMGTGSVRSSVTQNAGQTLDF